MRDPTPKKIHYRRNVTIFVYKTFEVRFFI